MCLLKFVRHLSQQQKDDLHRRAIEDRDKPKRFSVMGWNEGGIGRRRPLRDEEGEEGTSYSRLMACNLWLTACSRMVGQDGSLSGSCKGEEIKTSLGKGNTYLKETGTLDNWLDLRNEGNLMVLGRVGRCCLFH